MKKLLTALFLLIACNCFAQSVSEDQAIKNIIFKGDNENKTMELLDVLANRFGGRPLGSDAYSNACDWCEYEFKKWGVEVIKEEVGELPVGFNRGPWHGKMLGGNGMTLNFVTPSYTAGTKGIQRGHVLKEPYTTADFNSIKHKLNGAWVLIGGTNGGWPVDISAAANEERSRIIAKNDSIVNTNRDIYQYNRNIRAQRAEIQKQIDQNPSKATKLNIKLNALKEKEFLTLNQTPGLFYNQMKDAGALGMIQSSPVPLRALYDRKNIKSLTFETLPTLPDIKLDEEQYNQIAKMVDRREIFQLEIEIRNFFKVGPVKYHNMIGMIKGTEFPDEYVIVGGHLDAYDAGTGAVDCGTGASVSLEAARLIASCGMKPKRTILFALWAGEEFGLWGSQYFVEHHLDKLHSISNYFNRDGGPTVPVSITVTPEMYDDFVKVCAPLKNLKNDYGFEVKKRLGEPGPVPKNAGGTDHAHFVMHGVPAFSFSTGDPKGYDFDYDEIWHTDRDTYDKSIPEYMNQASTITAIVAFGIANLDHLLNRENLYKEEKK